MMNKKRIDSSLPARRRWSNASTTMVGHSGGSTSSARWWWLGSAVDEKESDV